MMLLLVPTGVKTFPHMPLDVNSTFIGHEDDVGDIDYDMFIPMMEKFRHNMSLDVGKYFSDTVQIIS